MDTCSVKVFPVQSMMENAPAEVEVIGTHPMFGPDSAAGGVTDLPMVMSKARCHPSTFIRYHEFFTGIGLRVVEMSPEEHDREAAMTQGVTHFLGRVLADLGLEPSSIATMGYQKLLEVMEQTCNDPYELFVDLQRYNPYTSLMRERLKESLAAVMGTLERPLDSGEEHP
jgi:prephenate dehydrogenase